MRHQQHFAVGIEEHPLHGAVGKIVVDADTGRFIGAGIGRHAHQAIEEIGRFGGKLQSIPAQAIGGYFTQWSASQLPIEFDERRMIGRRLDAIHPRPSRFAAGHGECGAGEQFGVEAVRGFLRRVLADRECAGQRFAAEFVAEA
ncbi:hypothetical protein D3C86_677860 [compost metagenome]